MEKVKQNRVVYGSVQLGKNTLWIAATRVGLCYIGGANEDFKMMQQWLEKHKPGYQLESNEAFIRIYKEQIHAYYEKGKKNITIPIDLIGTTFQVTVWQTLRNIPYGEVRTYSDIAEEIGKPNAVRAVGSAIGANPLLIVIPCHRVINKSGKLGGFRGGIQMKQMLLNLEKTNS